MSAVIRQQSRDSLRRVNTLVRQVTGQTPCTFRPPYGATSPALLARVSSLGMASVTWNVDPRDWSKPGTPHIISEASKGTNGSIVIMHDGPLGREQTAAAVRAVVLNYRRRGYTLLTVDELLGFTAR
jgi:peptidoglycan/xylan/chitin deacetylase (PgdA/CDA1 family)